MSSSPRTAGDIWRRLNGLVCVFKPACYSVNQCMKVLRHKLTVDLNAVEEARFLAAAALPHPGDGDLPEPGLIVSEPAPSAVSVPGPEAADMAGSALNPRLVTGPAFLPQDVRLRPLAGLGRHTSGPLLLGLNGGTRLVEALREAGPQLRVHQLTARLGLATDSLYADGRATERATYGHVTGGRLEAVLSGLQAAHQRHMFENTGLPVNSQAAYELAARGPPRPERGSPPVLYGLRCVHFAPPYFTLEVHGCNESEQYLLTLVHDLGRQLRSAAVTVRARCLRHGPFTLEHALLMKHWQVEHVRENMRQCMVTAAEGFAAPLSGTLQRMSDVEQRSAG